jgi:hypothetical protein
MANAQEYAERLAALFDGLKRAYGVYQLEPVRKGVVKRAGRARTMHGEVTLPLWGQHLSGEQGLGIVPIRDDGTCLFGAIDIDKYNLNYGVIEHELAKLGLPVIPCRTKSGGIHVYVFMKEPVPAPLLRARLSEWATAIGFGSSEIFPKQDALLNGSDVGNWINMPYFAALTKEGTERYGLHKAKPLSLDDFLTRVERCRITEEQLEALTIPEEELFLSGPPCLQALARSGFPEGVRNKGLFNIIVYLKKRFPDDWKERIQEYNLKYMKPEPLKTDEITQSMKSHLKKDYNYKCNDSPIKEVCNRRLCRKREFGVGQGNMGADDWPFMIDSDVQKICTDPPYWTITVDGTRVDVTSDHISSQLAFKKLIINRLNIVPPALKPNLYDEKWNDMLKRAQPIEAPEDSSATGEVRWYLEQFCTVHPQAQTREELLVGKPWTEEGRTFFRSPDFKQFLARNNFRDLTKIELYATLRKLGVQHCQMAIRKGISIQVWHVAAIEPLPDEETPTVPTHHVPTDNTEM